MSNEEIPAEAPSAEHCAEELWSEWNNDKKKDSTPEERVLVASKALAKKIDNAKMSQEEISDLKAAVYGLLWQKNTKADPQINQKQSILHEPAQEIWNIFDKEVK
jgi:hypothetical protein